MCTPIAHHNAKFRVMGCRRQKIKRGAAPTAQEQAHTATKRSRCKECSAEDHSRACHVSILDHGGRMAIVVELTSEAVISSQQVAVAQRRIDYATCSVTRPLVRAGSLQHNQHSQHSMHLLPPPECCHTSSQDSGKECHLCRARKSWSQGPHSRLQPRQARSWRMCCRRRCCACRAPSRRYSAVWSAQGCLSQSAQTNPSSAYFCSRISSRLAMAKDGLQHGRYKEYRRYPG